MNGAIEVWGGIECTINRIGTRFIDQLAQSGHYDRVEQDLDRLAALGIRTLRYPALWERIELEQALDRAEWAGSDARLNGLRQRGIEPILGLVHHGCGPSPTHLLDPSFATGLAAYARAVAERYPWVRQYIPVNEPLTTARFSALYGHWYPHCRDDRSFVAALLNQCRGVVLAMEAIRRVRPDALLVQTEDAGATRSTPALAEQAAFENERRWLSLDLLTGRVNHAHPLWDYLRRLVSEGELEWFEDHRAVPDIVGLNYYVTSDRYLDERFSSHPPVTHGGNGPLRYADVEAARVEGVGIRGHATALDEAWKRYRRPVAITEAHLGCTREEQMRWLVAAWAGACEAQRRGADVRAVTAWALFGSWDWDSLVTRTDGHYEPGAFDVRGVLPRPTAVATIVRALAEGRRLDHRVLSAPGWWVAAPRTTSGAPLLITGAGGTLGSAFARECCRRRIHAVPLTREQLDITGPDAVEQAVSRYRPWAIVNAAGYVRVDEAETNARTCRRINAVAATILAAACRKGGIRLLTFSTDLVFDGLCGRPYIETDAVSPLNVYGHTKVEAERRVLAFAPDGLIVRTSALFGPWDEHNFVVAALGAITSGRSFPAAADTTVSPTYVPDLVKISLDLLIDGATGIWHLANDGAITWCDFARRVVRFAGLDPERVQPCSSQALSLQAPRPRYSVLASVHGHLMPELDESLSRYFFERTRLGTAA